MMRRGWRGLGGVVLLGALGIGLLGCTDSSGNASSRARNVELEQVRAANGVRVQRLTLTPLAVHKLGVRTAGVQDEGGTKVVPYGAIVYDNRGDAWVYVTSKPRTYERSPVTVASIDGETARLSTGPDTGTDVVSVGAAELFGAERGYGD